MNIFNRLNKDVSSKFECDNSNGTCTLTDSLFRELWGWSYESKKTLPIKVARKFNGYWNRLGSDTMNSFSIIYRRALRINDDNKSIVDQNNNLQTFATLTHTTKKQRGV